MVKMEYSDERIGVECGGMLKGVVSETCYLLRELNNSIGEHEPELKDVFRRMLTTVITDETGVMWENVEI